MLSKWVMGKDFKFPKSSSQDLPYRISFVVLETVVIPLQQCVDHGRETIQVVNAAGWYREASSLTGFQLTPLILELERLSSISQTQVVEYPCPELLQRTVSIALKPVAPVYLVKRKGDPQSFMKTCGEILSRRPKEQKKQGAVIIERRGVQSWDFSYIGPWPVKESPCEDQLFPTASSRMAATHR